MFPRQAAALLALVPLIAWSCRDPSGPSVATILVTPPDAELVVGDALLLRAVGLSADGDTLRELQITWTSADTAVAVVSPAGLVTGRGQGTVVIRAASEGVQGQADLTVNVHFATVTTGIYHICGLNSEGSAYCWGANLFGELGNGVAAEFYAGALLGLLVWWIDHDFRPSASRLADMYRELATRADPPRP